MRTIPPLAAGVIFVVTCVLSEEVPAAQSAIEGDVQLDMMWQLPARLAGLLLIVVQTLSLASTGRAVLWHLRWPAKYLMGSYLLNLNFLDLCLLSPQVRWSAPQLSFSGCFALASNSDSIPSMSWNFCAHLADLRHIVAKILEVNVGPLWLVTTIFCCDEFGSECIYLQHVRYPPYRYSTIYILRGV